MGYVTVGWKFVGLLILLAESLGQVEWLSKPESVSAREGDNVTFVCRLSSPNPEIVWTKNDGEKDTFLFVKNTPWTNSSRYRVINQYDLVIQNVQKVDNGNYACRTKDAGVQTARLTVLLFPGPPRITRDVTGPGYTEGDVIQFSCSSTGGNPSPTIMWLKNGNVVTATAETQEAPTVGGTARSEVSVTLDKTDHQANYSCVVYNSLTVNNKLIDSVVLSVRYAPFIAFRPYMPVYNVKRGEDVEIFCDVDANPLVSVVSWSKDGVSLSGTSQRRRLSPARVSDHGNYTCSATNSVGERSGSLQLNVQYPPVITIPAVQTFNEGEDVSLTCDTDANPKPYETQWIKRTSNGAPRTIETRPTLTIRGVGREAAGNYSCEVHSRLNISGEGVEFVSSQAFMYLHVRYKPGQATIDPVPPVDVGERLDITCTASPAGYPEANYVWTKDGQELSTTQSSLTVASASLSDNGRYTCTPTNVRGSGQMATVDVSVYAPPSISQQPTAEMSVYLSDPNPVNLTCVAEGYPEPQISWYQEGDNQPLNGADKRRLFTVLSTTTPVGPLVVRRESTLQLKGSGREVSASGQRTVLQIRDMGNYSCQAESGQHSERPSARTQLLINFPPVLTDTASRLASSLLDSVSLLCSVQAHPDPTFQWIFQGSQLTSGRQGVVISHKALSSLGRMESNLTITNVSDRSYGVYTCLVKNSIGNTTKDIDLSAKSPPEKPKDLTSPSKTWESVRLTWSPGFDGGYPQRFFVQQSGSGSDPVRLEVKPLSATSFNVTKLRPSSTYTFQVVAANELGYGPQSTPVVVTTKDLKIPNLPEVPVFDAKKRKLILLPPQGNEYCLKVEVKSGSGDWSQVNGCMKVMGDTLEITHSGVSAVNVSVCLSHRTDVCGQPSAAEIRSSDNKPTLTEEHVIIIACVCGVIIITLLVILFCFIFRRRRNAAKHYQSGNQGDPPPYSTVASHKKPQVYDNQGMDTSDLQLTPQLTTSTARGGPEAPSRGPSSPKPPPPPPPPTVHASNSFTNNSYGPLDLRVPSSSGGAGSNNSSNSNNNNNHHPGTSAAAGDVSPRPRTVSPSAPSLDKHMYQNEMNRHFENNRMDGFPSRDAAGAGGVPHSPTKDKYITLQDRAGPGGDVVGPDAGYNNAGSPGEGGGAGGKPKKVIYEVVV